MTDYDRPSLFNWIFAGAMFHLGLKALGKLHLDDDDDAPAGDKGEGLDILGILEGRYEEDEDRNES